MSNEFAVFILSNGRPDRQKTYKSLLKCNYSGKIYFLIDDLDPTKKEYERLYGKKVIVFNKQQIAKEFDQGDNFQSFRGVVYARNANFQIAKDLGLKYFVQLDDDYEGFFYRFNDKRKFIFREKKLNNIDNVFNSLIRFFESTPTQSIALSQNGDFIGGKDGMFGKKLMLRRKCMNSFLCSTERPFKFVGRINEDVNTYAFLGSIGKLFFTTNQVSLKQTTTQKNKGGMTELYLDSGTYVKSFYSVMYQPSSVKVKLLNSTHPRLHHAVNWKCTVPMILKEELKRK